MIKGLYAAASGMEAAWQYQEMLANNVANATTVGFRREVAALQSFDDVLISQQASVVAPLSARIQDVVGQIGTGTFVAEFQTDFQQGPVERSGNELDLALQSGFFAIETVDGVRYTRDGRFGRDANGDLVTSAGDFVLDVNGQRIALPSEAVTVGGDGVITREGAEIAQLQVVDFSPLVLERAGESYFDASEAGTPVEGAIIQGALEGSNSQMVEELTSLLAVYRTYQANQTVLAQLDGSLGQAAGSLGDFGAAS